MPPQGPPYWRAVALPVLADDTQDSLSARVLTHEHVIYPQAVRWVVEDQLSVTDGVVRHRQGAAQVRWGG